MAGDTLKANELIQGAGDLAKEMALLNKEFKETIQLIIQGQKVFDKQAKSQGDVAKKTTQVKKATSELEKIQARANKVTLETVRATESLRKKRKALTDQVRKEQGTFKKSGGLFRSMTKSILAAGAAFLSLRAAFTVVKNGFKTIVQFEKGMSAVRAITGATAKEFKTLQENALLLGRTTSKTALQVAQLQVEFAKLGFTTAEILAATEATINLSIAAGTDLAEAAVVAASTIRGFGLSATESTRVIDVMAKSFSSSALDLEKFKIAMSKVAPVAKASGKTIEFATAQLAVLSDAGLEASIAGTSLRNIFLELNKRGLTWEQGLEKINTSTNKNVTALELFGKRGATAALILAENTEKSEELKIAFDNAAGSAKAMADIMEDNLAGDITKAASAWEGFIHGLNDGTGALSKAGRSVIQFGTNAIRSLNTLDLWFKSEKRFTSDDFDRLLENMDFVKTESGKTVREIVDNFEELNKGLSTEDLLKRSAEFKNLFKAEGETVKSSLGLWAAYVREREGQIQIEKDAILAAEQAAIDAAKEAARVKAALVEKEAKEIAEKELRIQLKKSNRQIKISADADKEEIDNRIAANDNFIENFNEELDAQTEKELENLANQLDEEARLKQEAAEADIDLTKLTEDQKKEIKVAAIEGAGQIVSDQLTAGINEDLAAFQTSQDIKADQLKNRLDKGEIDELEYQKEIEKLEKQSRIETAKAEKKKALYDVGIATAVGIAKAIPNLPLMAVAAALGAIQLSVVASKPIPKFKHGSNGELQLDTTAIVGDGGKPELITTPKGDFLSPSTDTMVHLPRGSQVFGGDSPETKSALSGGMTEEMYNGLLNEQRLTRKAIESKQSQPILTEAGVRVHNRKSNSNQLWIDNYIRG